MRQEWKGTGIKPVAVPTPIQVIITVILTAFSLSAFLQRVLFGRGNEPIACCCGICHMQISTAKLFSISSTTSMAWFLNPGWCRRVFWEYLSDQSPSSFQECLSFCRLLHRFHPTDKQTFSSKGSHFTTVQILSLVGWKELIWLTFSPPLTPLTVRGLSGQWVYWQAVS